MSRSGRDSLPVAKNVRALRRSLSMTQDELADRAGLHRVYLAQLELGIHHNQTLDTLQRLAKALGVSLIELLDPHLSTKEKTR